MRTGMRQKGQFNIQRGMAFIMPDLNEIHDNKRLNAGQHPWLITNVFNDYIEIIMCTTLISNIEDKHRTNDKSLRNNTDIRNPCPPMDRQKDRMSGAALNTEMLLPKKELFSHPIHILNETMPNRNFKTHGLEALCLNPADINNIQKETREYQKQHGCSTHDPFECEEYETYLYDLEDEETRQNVPKWFTRELYEQKFAWRYLPKADWKAVYPFEDQMHDYEKTDPELMRIARIKKSGSKQKSKPEKKLTHNEIVRRTETINNRITDSLDDSYQKE